MSVWKRFRSAIKGIFVTKEYAEQNPDTTVSETVKPRPTAGDALEKQREQRESKEG
ncbi:MAG TPA: hypothetical protein VNL15_06050 [Dehalococcoidia bacterium]|nr:hypothetical protein [Dehalococcoidia bacterium]